jgi:molybdopterin-binding protein
MGNQMWSFIVAFPLFFDVYVCPEGQHGTFCYNERPQIPWWLQADSSPDVRDPLITAPRWKRCYTSIIEAGRRHGARNRKSNIGGEIVKISARNMLKGRVSRVVHGAVNTEIEVELPGGTKVVSIITKTSAENMALKEGQDVYAVIKASNVMIATD